MDEKPYQPSDIELKAINLIDAERVAFETTVSFVTDRVAFNMKNLIRQLRKNWWGIFDEPIDPQTGHKKIWVPLTESVGETVVKNVDLDTKDVNFRAKKPSAVKFTSLIRSIVKNNLDEMRFGEKLDELETILARDGTCVWKTYESKEKNGKYCTNIQIVDLLNVYIDPTSPSIQEAYRFTERAYMYPDEIKQQKGWLNTANIKGTTYLPRNDGFFANRANTLSTVKAADVWESWGKYPKSLLTGKSEDTEDVDLHIIISGLEAGDRRVHLIEKYSGLKPYEEAWYAKVPGRWYGKGIAEKLMMLQIWINTIANIRITRDRLATMGLFKIRRGSGITPQMIAKLPNNGAVYVNSQEDLQQFVMQEAGMGSYNEENNIYSWSQRVTSAFEVVTGEQLPADTSATATALQTRSATSQFVLVKEQIGMFLQRWLKNHAIPTMLKNLTQGELVEMAINDDDLRSWDEMLIFEEVAEKLEKANSEGLWVDPEEVQMEIQRAMASVKAGGKSRFTKLDFTDFDSLEYDVAIDITNESVDKGVISQNLIMALQAAPEYRDQILPQLFDLMGLSFTKPQQQPMPMLQNGQPAGAGAQPSPMSPQTQNPAMAMTRANTMINQNG